MLISFYRSSTRIIVCNYSSRVIAATRRRNAGTEQRLPSGGFRGGRRGKELASSPVRQGHIPRVVHTDHRGHVPAGDQL